MDQQVKQVDVVAQALGVKKDTMALLRRFQRPARYLAVSDPNTEH
jgi:hypothetical protein